MYVWKAEHFVFMLIGAQFKKYFTCDSLWQETAILSKLECVSFKCWTVKMWLHLLNILGKKFLSILKRKNKRFLSNSIAKRFSDKEEGFFFFFFDVGQGNLLTPKGYLSSWVRIIKCTFHSAFCFVIGSEYGLTKLFSLPIFVLPFIQ